MKECFIYVMARRADDGWCAPVKVGISTNPEARLATINTSSPFRVEIYRQCRIASRWGAESIERTFHAINEKERLNGEWFQMEPDAAVLCLLHGLCHVFIHHEKRPVEQIAHWFRYTGAEEAIYVDGENRQWGINFNGEPREQ